MTSMALEFRNVSYRYPRADRWVLRDINLKVQENSFLILAGPTGSGKSTLLKVARGLHKEYGGELRGNIHVLGEDTGELGAADLGSKIAIIFQNPAYQLHQLRVIDEIMSAPIYQALPWQECLERAQQSSDEILGGRLLDRNPVDLSTGEQQKTALAASLAMRADVLLLDEPFSYLDVRATDDFLGVVKRLKAKGKTIILATHNLEPVAHLADEIALIDEGRVVVKGTVRDVLYSDELSNILGRPLFLEIGDTLFRKGHLEERPLCWNDLAERFNAVKGVGIACDNSSKMPKRQREHVLEVCGVSYDYPNGNRGVKDVSLAVERGEILGVVGSNGSGKTTLAKLMLGLIKPSSGHVMVFGEKNRQVSDIASKVGYVTQNPSEMLFETTVFRECSFGPISLGKRDPQVKVETILSKLGLLKYAENDPRSLSGGEQRLLTVAAVLVNDPQVLILDEPEFGLDPKVFQSISAIIRGLRDEGKTIVLITQNLEATAFLCDRIALMKEGKVVKTGRAAGIYCDEKLLEEAGLRYLAFFSIFARVTGETEEPLDGQAFVDALMSVWSREAQ